MSSKAIYKEQCTKCKCIVKERDLGKKKDASSSNNNGSRNGCGNSNGSVNGRGSQVPCVEAYRDLSECLQKAIVAVASQTKKKDDCSY